MVVKVKDTQSEIVMNLIDLDFSPLIPLSSPHVSRQKFLQCKELDASGQKRTSRRVFSKHSGLRRRQDTNAGIFNVPFRETIGPLFESATGIPLYLSKFGQNFYCYIRSEEQYKSVEKWINEQGKRVFLRDKLSLSIALGEYCDDLGEHNLTQIGQLEHDAKWSNNLRVKQAAITELVDMCISTILCLDYYNTADAICAVPSSPGKQGLPKEIVARVSKKLGWLDITDNLKFFAEKVSIKELPMAEKWDALEASDLRYLGPPLNDKTIILLDDLYQSGTTIHFVASKLQQAGTRHILGLSLVKGMRDTDNK